MNNLKKISGQFRLPGRVVSIQPYGNGNINDTFLVHLAGKPAKKCILQRINSRVFPRPELIMENIRRLTGHVRKQLKKEGASDRWQIMELYQTVNDEDFLRIDSSCWRMIGFIDNARCHEKIKNQAHAREIGRGLGRFHALLSSLSPEKMAVSLPGFHQTPHYLKIYDSLAAETKHQVPEVKFCRKFIDQHRELAGALEMAKQHIPLRIIHGDPKINNIMIDSASGRVAGMIDLDTVQPGLIHYDIGDCLRSCCNPLNEDIAHPEKTFFDSTLCQVVLQGYFSEARGFITPREYDYIFTAINLIPFELGLRFFSDFLSGDSYFKTKYPGQNLRRALVQFYLTRSIEKQEKRLREIIDEFRK